MFNYMLSTVSTPAISTTLLARTGAQSTVTLSFAIFFFVIFLVVAGVHLFACVRRDVVLRRRTKVWLIPLLAFAFLFAAAYLGGISRTQQVFVVVLLFYWTGDVFLAFSKNGGKGFIAGASSFMLGHLLLIAVLIDCVNWQALRTDTAVIALVSSIAVYFLAVALVARNMRGYMKRKMWVLAVIYMSVNAAANVMASAVAITTTGFAAMAAWLGALCFFVSDVVLISVRFNENSRITSHTLVMTLYLCATTLVSYAVLMLG